jgi:hypothetical protein
MAKATGVSLSRAEVPDMVYLPGLVAAPEDMAEQQPCLCRELTKTSASSP